MKPKPAGKRTLTSAIQNNFWVFFGSIWLLVGLPFVLLAGYFIVQERQLATTGRVVDAIVLTKDISRSGDTKHRSVRYRFTTAEGRTIEGKSEVEESIWSSLTERGPVRVAYLPNRPSVNRVLGSSELTMLLIFSFVGCLLSIAGGTIVTVALRRARLRTRLLTKGVRAPATVAEVKAMNLRVNGRPQWKLKYEYRDHQSRSHFRSLYLDADEASRWNAGRYGGCAVRSESSGSSRLDRQDGRDHIMKHLLDWARMFGLVLAAAVLSEMPGIKQASQAVDRLRDPLLGVAIGLAALGFAVFMGGILSMLMASGEPMTHEEIEAAIGQRHGAGEPAAWRASAHRVFGPAAGEQAANETTFAGMKDAWRSGEWRRDPHWRRLFLIASGAALLFVRTLRPLPRDRPRSDQSARRRRPALRHRDDDPGVRASMSAGPSLFRQALSSIELFAGIVLLAIGGVLFSVTGQAFLHERAYRRGVQADAVVIRKHIRPATSDSSTAYELTYRRRIGRRRVAGNGRRRCGDLGPCGRRRHAPCSVCAWRSRFASGRASKLGRSARRGRSAHRDPCLARAVAVLPGRACRRQAEAVVPARPARGSNRHLRPRDERLHQPPNSVGRRVRVPGSPGAHAAGHLRTDARLRRRWNGNTETKGLPASILSGRPTASGPLSSAPA